MTACLDSISRQTIARFSFKLCLAMAISLLGQSSYMLVTSAWLSLYAGITAILALLGGIRFQMTSLTHWDEVLWLVAISQALKIAHRMLLP